MWVIEEVLGVDRAEAALAGAEHDRRDVHGHLVDETEREGLSSHSPAATETVGYDAPGCQPSGFGSVGHHDDVLTACLLPRSANRDRGR